MTKKLAVGFFDGVHLGHRAILDGADAALTFLRHPAELLEPEAVPARLMTLEERIRAIGLPVLVLDFTPELAKMPAAEFAERYLAGYVIRCGENWRFGYGAEGSPDWLRAHGYEVETVPLARYRGEPVSSTRIREAIAAGRLEDAAAMLGREVSVSGAVFAGKGEGAKLGYPTINLRPGVYEVEVGGEKGIANYGIAPTFGDRAWKEPVLEVHMLRYLREERRFASAEELRRQIDEDVKGIMK